MHAFETPSNSRRRVALLAAGAAALAAPLALPSGASAHHQCDRSQTVVTVNPAGAQPVEVDHRLAVLFACSPHRVGVVYVEPNGTTNDASLQSGDFTVTQTEAPQPVSPASTDQAAPSETAKPKRKAKRSCRKARKSKARSRSRRCSRRRHR